MKTLRSSRVHAVEVQAAGHLPVRRMARQFTVLRLEAPARTFRMKLEAFKTKGVPSPDRQLAGSTVWRVTCADVLRVSREGLAATRSDRPCDLSVQPRSYSRSR